jgi:hypothetical protein
MANRVLTADEVDHFWAEGYVLVKGAATPDETQRGHAAIMGLLPADLDLPDQYASHGGRIKPHSPDGNHSYYTPELIPLLASGRLYGAASDIFGHEFLGVGDGSVGITLKDSSGPTLSQRLHLDMHRPDVVDETTLRNKVGIGGCYYLSTVDPGGAGIHIIPRGPSIVAERALEQAAQGDVEFPKTFDDYPESIEVTAEAGDFVMMHHLMPHAASRNRLGRPRVVQFTRYRHLDEAAASRERTSEDKFSAAQLAAMTPLARRLFGLDAWL